MEQVIQHLGQEHQPHGIQVLVQQRLCHSGYNHLVHRMVPLVCRAAVHVPYLARILHRKKVRQIDFNSNHNLLEIESLNDAQIKTLPLWKISRSEVIRLKDFEPV